ncbi:histidine kinase [Kribbella sp. NPDC051770]|uniref:sensor histidine kinase n=1 Tax=Kribbella sp. NPDC051770 TaxID=3155413 RepID=UPI00341BEC3A
MTSGMRLPLYWRVCLINGLLFVVGTMALAFLPVTVSARVLVSEAIVLVLGLAAIVGLNSLLLRTSLAPLDRLVRTMDEVDLQRPGHRLPEGRSGVTTKLIHSFNAMLTRLETERSTSNAKALAAQEAERHRIAQELHDQIGQSLTAVLLGLKRLSDRVPDDLAEEFRMIQETTRTGLDEVREVARRLRPGVLEDLGLHNALAALATEFSSHGMRVRRVFSPGLPALAPETELVVYRVAQEALTNAARHSSATEAEIALRRQGRYVVLSVEDNGRGGRGPIAEGAGIRGMRERALLVSGEISVGPGPRGGVRVELKVT